MKSKKYITILSRWSSIDTKGKHTTGGTAYEHLYFEFSLQFHLFPYGKNVNGIGRSRPMLCMPVGCWSDQVFWIKPM
jgi:hypothetical protein